MYFAKHSVPGNMYDGFTKQFSKDPSLDLRRSQGYRCLDVHERTPESGLFRTFSLNVLRCMSCFGPISSTVPFGHVEELELLLYYFLTKAASTRHGSIAE